MKLSLKNKVLLWFLFVVVAVALAGFSGYHRLANYIRNEAERQMTAKMEHVVDVLEANNAINTALVRSSMAVLKMIATQDGPVDMVSRDRPDGSAGTMLAFGQNPAAENFALVDKTRDIMGGSVTIFEKRGDTFVRVMTNVENPDGSRAIGTILDPDGPAIAKLLANEPFYGVVDILGKPFITGYEPIRDASGQTVGAYYVGYAIDSLVTLSDVIELRGVLNQGFFALVDRQDHIIFQTKKVASEAEISSIVHKVQIGQSPGADWFVEMRTFSPWDYDIVAALYLPDVRAMTLNFIWQVYGVATFVIIAILILSFWLVSRLSSAHVLAEARRQEAVVARDAAESANRTKSTFLANMSHELRTPMNAIIGYSEMLLEESEDLGVTELAPDLQKIRGAGKHLLALINDILDLSKIEAGRMTVFPEDFALPEMLREVIATIQPLVEKNGNTLVIQCPPDAGAMRSDLTKVRQTLFNLLSNASKFTEKGRITVAVERIVRETGDRIQFIIADTGIGMTSEQLGRLFQAFTQADASTTRKYGGTGLGLLISRKFCQLLGGDITVASTPGEGTIFTVDLPATFKEIPTGKISTPATKPSSPSTPSTRRRLLVIDDDLDAADILNRNLTKSGYDVHVAHSGPEGLELARSIQPAAITLDVMMPGMDGWSVLTALKSDPITSSIPVIMVTMLRDRQLGFTLGATEFLTKPVDQERLRTILASQCSAPTAEVLVVDDDADSRELICRLLEKEGLRPTEAENGQDALQQMHKVRPALIILDLMMPVMDGFEFLEAIHQVPELSNIPVVIITAKDLTAEDRERLAGGVQAILQKGAVDQKKFLHNLTAILEKKF